MQVEVDPNEDTEWYVFLLPATRIPRLLGAPCECKPTE